MPPRLHSFFECNSLSDECASAQSFPRVFAFSRRAGWLCLLLAIFAFAGPIHAESAKNYFKAGKRAEIREDYVTAYQNYRQAWLAKPDDMKYKESYERLRFMAASQYLDLGRQLFKDGNLNDALTDFLRAVAIDPSNEAAQQEVDRTRAKINGAQPPPSADDSAR